MSVIPENIQEHWSIVSPLFSIQDENEYDLAIERLNALIDEIGVNERHPLYELLDTLGAVIYVYEEKHYPMPERSGVKFFQSLVENHQLKPSNPPEVGTPDTVSEIFGGQMRSHGQAPSTLDIWA